MNDWVSTKKVQKLKSAGIEAFKKESLKHKVALFCVTTSCPHCNSFKKNLMADVIKKLNGAKHCLCDVGESSYYREMLMSTGHTSVPKIMLFDKGNLTVFNPEEFLNK